MTNLLMLHPTDLWYNSRWVERADGGSYDHLEGAMKQRKQSELIVIKGGISMPK